MVHESKMILKLLDLTTKRGKIIENYIWYILS